MLRDINGGTDSVCVGNDVCQVMTSNCCVFLDSNVQQMFGQAIYYNLKAQDGLSMKSASGGLYHNTNRQQMLSEHITEQIVLKVLS